ncbi:MAG: hypothetical protein AB7T86_18055 [Xanthobacteraceae bacterium]|uniref:hypothetical protein n=1 Tax=Pseudolabrys sp. TaxID=1960880 RepID=UPI003D11FBED
MGKPRFAIEQDSDSGRSTDLAAPGADDAALDITLGIDPAFLIADFVPAGARVLDLGATVPELHSLLPHGCAYMACGKSASREGVLPCDLEGGEFPADAASGADIVVLHQMIERVADADALAAHLRAAGCTVILSCAPTDLTADLAGDAARGANHRFGFYELTRLFDRHGFRIECSAPAGEGQMVMRLAPERKIKPVIGCRVAVLAEGDDFGARVGRELIASVLPGEASIDWFGFDQMKTVQPGYDLVVLGAGGALPPSVINDALLGFASCGRAAIGIFGTQYRELIPRAGIERLIDRLDVWYARHEADAMMYGRGRENVTHLGDWLIDRFPLARGTINEPLLIGANAGADADLAATIAFIQRHAGIFTTHPAAFLCALTAAETAAWCETPDSRLPGLPSGEFRSLLIDVFGRSFPEKDFFLVDRDAVMRYKARVRANVVAMREKIAALIEAKARAAA